LNRGHLYIQVHPAEINTLLERMSEPLKPWSVADFERLREPLVDFVKTKVLPLLHDTECRRIVIRAPVKSGKREMVEYIAMRDKQDGSARRVHAFLSAWHRVADDSQREELKKHNLTNSVFSIINTVNTNMCIQWINLQVARGKHVVLHLDECDHGSGQKQMLSRVWRSTRDNVNITNILYSATPEEVLFSGEIDDEYADDVAEIMEGHIVYYKPPRGYCGPRKFLRKGLVFNAKPFFTKVGATYRLTEQGKEIVRDLRAGIATNPERNIVVLRLSYCLGAGTRNERKENKAIYQFLENRDKFTDLEDFIVIADKGDKFGGATRVLKEDIKWSDDMYWESKATGRPILIVIDQTSSRSTEWRCHNRIFATHDYRDSVTFSVVSQAQERVNHYKQRYGGRFQPIRVYGHRKSWELSAAKISYQEYLTNEWTKRKVDRRTAGDAELYRILKTATGAVHPAHTASMSEAAADGILLNLGCGATVNVSARVRGGVREVPIYNKTFHVYDAMRVRDTRYWNDIRERLNNKVREINPSLTHNFRVNPFERSIEEGMEGERYKGQLRGFRVFDFEDVKCSTGGCRITICYRGSQLGIALLCPTGDKETKDTMTAFQSMYSSRA
jgi:hypothetical protein